MNTEYKIMAGEQWNGAIWIQMCASDKEGGECGKGIVSAKSWGCFSMCYLLESIRRWSPWCNEQSPGKGRDRSRFAKEGVQTSLPYDCAQGPFNDSKAEYYLQSQLILKSLPRHTPTQPESCW